MAADHQTVTVLLAAESGELTNRLATRLEQEGCIVKRAGDSAETLVVAALGFDLILLELELPGFGGLAVLRRLRDNPAAATTPIFLLKGENEAEHLVQRGLDFGASGYLSKHRLPGDLDSTSIVDPLLLVTSLLEVYESGHNVATNGGRADMCPYSSRHKFGRCQAYLALHVSPADNGSGAIVSCSHLRVGVADSWRLYPRCAIGDHSARDRYVEAKTPA